MTDIIQLLPDSVANQIAAGEVIQRPASVVKELVENSIDAGASEIVINIKDAGKTLIQISDDGCGMSPTDARMAFERHATSKINNANDLFCIRTMGFRGEALASIAAIADVELKTKRVEDEVGTLVHIVGSQVKTQEPVATGNGTTFLIKNLFFNVPARRKFLKSDTTELKHIINEVHRVALPNPDIKFVLISNSSTVYELPKANLRKRVIDTFGKNLHQSLVTVDEDTSIIKVKGFVGQPKYARKTMGEQFFFVNGRFMKHYFFHKAVMVAYEKLMPVNYFPSYFLYLETDSANIDVNVHPTKTEIKFENEKAIWQIINAAVRESLGKHNVVPSIDFDQSGNIDIPVAKRDKTQVVFPKISIDPNYNPFEQTEKSSTPTYTKSDKENLQNWEKLYEGAEKKPILESNQQSLKFTQIREIETQEAAENRFMQLKNKYVLIPVKSGLMMIDQRRAHERILYEKFMAVIQSEHIASQQQLFPQTLELNASDATVLNDILDDLLALGFDIRPTKDNSFIINGTPGLLDVNSPTTIVEQLLEEFKKTPVEAKTKAKEQVAQSLAKASALNYDTHLKIEEINHLIDQLFACATPNFTPDGRKVIVILPSEDIEKNFK